MLYVLFVLCRDSRVHQQFLQVSAADCSTYPMYAIDFAYTEVYYNIYRIKIFTKVRAKQTKHLQVELSLVKTRDRSRQSSKPEYTYRGAQKFGTTKAITFCYLNHKEKWLKLHKQRSNKLHQTQTNFPIQMGSILPGKWRKNCVTNTSLLPSSLQFDFGGNKKFQDGVC